MSNHPSDHGGDGRRPNPRHQDNYPHAGKAFVRCTDCGLVHAEGRWRAATLADGADRAGAGLCPACKQVRDGRPAGTLVLDEPFLPYAEEIVGMAQNEERAERPEHPLERLLGVESRGRTLVVTTTGVHLARRIAHKLERRFHRDARYRYDEGRQELRVDWDGA